MKKWRVVVIIYYTNSSTASYYQRGARDTLRLLATLYRLDYAIVGEDPSAHDGGSPSETTGTYISDLVHFRAQANTRMSSKQFREVIASMFRSVPDTLQEGYMFRALAMKYLPQYPFPHEFYHPLNHPWLQHHKDGRAEILCAPVLPSIVNGTAQEPDVN